MKKCVVGLIVLVAVAMVMWIFVVLKHNRSNIFGHLSKQDSLYIESITGRIIIGDIDTTLISPYMRSALECQLKQERRFVKQSVNKALGYIISDCFSVVHFFYDEDLNCHYACPDLYVWLSDCEAKKLRSHILNLRNGTDILIEKSDTIHRKIKMDRIMIKSTLSGSCSGSCNGYTTTLMFNPKMNSITIHNHHQYFCQTHTVPGLYENFWNECQMVREAQNHGVKLIWEKRR